MRAKQAHHNIQSARVAPTVVAALVAAGISLIASHAHAEKRPYRLNKTDCVITSDASCVGPNAKATMVIPQQKAGPSANSADGNSLPAGYTERVLKVSPGAISAETFSTLRDVAGWPVFTCNREPDTFGTCSDGRSFDAVVTNNCNGVFQNKIYTWTRYENTIPWGDDTPTRVFAAGGHVTCAPANSEFAYLVRDSTASTKVNRDLSSAQVQVYAARTGTDAVSADQTSATQLCKEYGATAVYTASVGAFSSCRNNTLSVYIEGAWTRRNACTAGNQRVNSITCSFPTP